MCHMCFWKYGVPTCGTRPGWRCRRRWAWLRGLWHTWDHSQSISLEKLDTKHVPYMFLMILTNSLSCFHWLSSSTSMGVSMTSNRVQTYFSVYTTVPRASPENFISLSWKLVYFAACPNSCLRSAEGPPPFVRYELGAGAKWKKNKESEPEPTKKKRGVGAGAN